MTRPHSLAPCVESARVIFVSKNFAPQRGISHTGLGVSCQLKATVLWREGIWAETWQCATAADIAARIISTQAEAITRSEPRLSHVIVAAPWVATSDFAGMLMAHPAIHFGCICHSDVGFLQADARAMQLVKEYCDLSLINRNFDVAGNSRRFCNWARAALSPNFLYLRNLYDTQTFRPPSRPGWQGRDLRIGCFGAQRALKNHITAAAAALEIARSYRLSVEFHVSSGRDDASGRVYEPIRQLLSGHRTKLVLNAWRPWPEFRTLVGYMDLNMQPSYTESFNVVSADSVSEGVPICTSPTVDWLPETWHASPDDAHELAVRSMALLHNPHAAAEGQEYLRRYVREGIADWKEYLLN